MSSPPASEDPAAATSGAVKPSYDPGWNDPPMFAYTTGASVQTAQKPKLLNKRIAFPIQSGPTTTAKVQTSDAGLPMPFARVQHQPPPPLGFAAPTIMGSSPPQFPPMSRVSLAPIIAKPTPEPANDEDQSDIMDNTLLRLRNTLAELEPLFEAQRKKELDKRLGVLGNAWLDGHLDTDLQHRLRDFSLALESNNRLAEATEIHRSLAVDYGTVSAPWAATLRSLILAKQPQAPKIEAIDSDEPDTADILLDTTRDDMQQHMRAADFVPGQVQHL